MWRGQDRYDVFVYGDGEDPRDARLYSIPATSEADARLVALILDGGLGPVSEEGRRVELGEVELAYEWTEIIAVHQCSHE
jgi:hypothetical protein